MGIKNISNIDISSNVIKSMKERFKDNKPEMKWDVMDVRDLKFSSNHFDIVIDKALMDTIMCGENSFCSVALMTKEVQRVLKTGGIYVIVSYGDPEIRLPHLNREHLSFNISYQIIRKNFQFDPKDDDEDFFPNNPIEKTNFVYICKKKVGADSVCQENYPTVFYELDKQETIQEEDFMESEDENK
jgi:SAM-dependent methyltransferase